MTTIFKKSLTLILGAITLLGYLGSVFFAYAQNETTATPTDQVDGEIATEQATSTESVATSTESVEAAIATAPASWFKVEQLTGEVNQGDMVVGPGRAELEIKPGQSVVYEISVANRISDDRTFNLEVEDIAGTEDGNRAVMFLGDADGPYTVKDYISFEQSSFKLNLGERARIPVRISVPPNAAPGGYYGGVLVSTIKDEGDIVEGGARSPIIARVGTLFFITVPGEITKSGSIKDLTLTEDKWWYEKGPISLSILAENTGSVHLNPYGEIRIKNLFGEEVGFVELEPWFVLPKSLRTREVVWDRDILFGRYTATALINRGYDDVVDEVSVSFWVLPWKVMATVFGAVFLLLFGFRLLLKNFEFKRKS